jgi:hypothetical protein
MMFNDAFFKNDATPHLVLEAEKGLTDVQRKQIEAWWKSKHQGAKKAGTMAILEGGMKARTIAPTHKDMDFIEQKKMMREEILGEYRCPKALFNITDTLNYATFNGQMKVFWLYTIVPMLRKVEDAINYGYMRKYAKGITFSFDFRNVPAFAEDFNQKVISAKTLFDMGFTRNEINEEMEFGFEQQPWGDEWWVGAGMSPASSWSMEDEPAPKEEPAPAKSAIDIAIDKAFPQSVKKQALLRSFLKKQEVIEKKFYRKLKRYFFDYRASLLALPDMNLANKDLTMNLEQMDDKLKKMLEPLYREAIDGGVDGAKDDVGNEKSIEQEVKNRLEAFLQFQLTNITGINKTVRKQLLAKIDSAMAEGVISGGTMTEIASGVRDVIRDYFNYDVGYKSKLIARTETVGAMNGAKMEYYDEVGVEKKEWTTANDEVVRESHRECQSVGAIPLNETFPNGLMYAGDQSTGDASEVCNCRCTVVASIVGRD